MLARTMNNEFFFSKNNMQYKKVVVNVAGRGLL
jgi:hypothetical protein